MKFELALPGFFLLSSALASVPDIFQRDDGGDYDWDATSACPNGVQTFYTTVTTTVWWDESVTGTGWTASPTGSDGQWNGGGGDDTAYTSPMATGADGSWLTAGAGDDAQATATAPSDGSYGSWATGSDMGYGSGALPIAGSEEPGSDAGYGSGSGGEASAGSYGSGAGSDGSSGGSYGSGSDQGYGSVTDSGSWPTDLGYNPLKPSVVPTATYGPWVVVDGDVHDYSNDGSGAWSPPENYPKNNNYGSGSDRHGSDGYDSGSDGYTSGNGDYDSGSSTASASNTVYTGWPSSGSGSGARTHTRTSSTVRPSGSGHHGGSSGHPSPTASRSHSPLPPRPSHSGNCHACGGNTASTRNQWCEYDLQTDYYETVPCTGKTREYFFELAEHECAPDGYPRLCQTINGQLPGPAIEADWGDDVVVHVTNNLPASSHNGTSLHFHGIQQLNTNSADGANSVTQCPTAPGQSYTYRWTATEYGTSWYHAHFGFQAWNGVAGPIVINGPASANYDVDLGPILITDWNHWTADMIYPIAQALGPVTELTGLINGKNKWNTSMSSLPTSPGIPGGAGGPPPPTTRKRNVAVNGTHISTTAGVNATQTAHTNGTLIGEYYSIKFEQGVSYRLRLVNVAIDSGFKFSIDNHVLTVIATDFVPIQPYETDMLFITMGQRYDVIVKADQSSAKDYWMRAIPQLACSDNSNQLNIKGIVHYGDSTAEPATTAYTYTDECADEPLASLVPVLAKNVGPADYQTSEAVSTIKNANNFFEWTLNGTSYLVNWNDPALLDVYDNNTASLKAKTNLITLPKRDEWFYLLITEVGLPVPHPIHLHGHDFYVLGAGSGIYTGTEPLQTVNPPRRDVALLPAAGWLMLAWKADNPGTWLAHCHIGWHTLEGFALQFLELEDEILTTPGVIDDQLVGTCDSWNRYAAQDDPVQGVDGLVDSGL